MYNLAMNMAQHRSFNIVTVNWPTPLRFVITFAISVNTHVPVCLCDIFINVSFGDSTFIIFST